MTEERDAIDTAPITAAGQIFAMSMSG